MARSHSVCCSASLFQIFRIMPFKPGQAWPILACLCWAQVRTGSLSGDIGVRPGTPGGFGADSAVACVLSQGDLRLRFCHCTPFWRDTCQAWMSGVCALPRWAPSAMALDLLGGHWPCEMFRISHFAFLRFLSHLAFHFRISLRQMVASRQSPATSHQPPATKHEKKCTRNFSGVWWLVAAWPSHQPPDTSRQPPATSHHPQIMVSGHQPPAANHPKKWWLATSHQPPNKWWLAATSHQPPATSHQPTATGQPPATPKNGGWPPATSHAKNGGRWPPPTSQPPLASHQPPATIPLNAKCFAFRISQACEMRNMSP